MTEKTINKDVIESKIINWLIGIAGVVFATSVIDLFIEKYYLYNPDYVLLFSIFSGIILGKLISFNSPQIQTLSKKRRKELSDY